MNGIGKMEYQEIDKRKSRVWGKIKDQKRKWNEGRGRQYRVMRNRIGRNGNGKNWQVKGRKVGERVEGM